MKDYHYERTVLLVYLFFGLITLSPTCLPADEIGAALCVGLILGPPLKQFLEQVGHDAEAGRPD